MAEEQEQQEQESKGGNIGLPFGLCKKYGIRLSPSATPRDAWNALKAHTGMTPEQFYAQEKSAKWWIDNRQGLQDIYALRSAVDGVDQWSTQKAKTRDGLVDQIYKETGVPLYIDRNHPLNKKEGYMYAKPPKGTEGMIKTSLKKHGFPFEEGQNGYFTIKLNNAE